ncbi:MAG: chemotaxis protein CheW [Proteobacteria bacterium]|nr:chemotaxis protein CheW [Pseudomonadota bacterium]
MNASASSQAVSARRQPTRAIDPGGDDKDTQAAGEPTQFLTFSLNGEMFAVGIDNIKEIIEFGQPTEVPMMPGFIRGVINLRGAVVPVIDLNARFGRTASAVSRRSCIVIVEVPSEDGAQDIGIMVDAVSAVLEIPASEIEPPPSFGSRIRSEFLQGMGKVDGRFVMILSIAHVLSVDELAQLGEAVDASAAA